MWWQHVVCVTMWYIEIHRNWFLRSILKFLVFLGLTFLLDFFIAVTTTENTVKAVLSNHSKVKKKTKIGFQDWLSLNAGQKYCSILQYFWPSLSYHLSLRSLFCLFLSGCLRQVLLYIQWTIPSLFYQRRRKNSFVHKGLKINYLFKNLVLRTHFILI